MIRKSSSIVPWRFRTLSDRMVQLARSLKVTRGGKLRVDTTAVEANVHLPTDSALFGNVMRVVSRLLLRPRPLQG
jgi:IS5 family transposase